MAVMAAVAVVGLDSSIIDRPALYVGLRVAGCAGLVALAIVFTRLRASGQMAGLLLAAALAVALGGLTAADSPWPFVLGRIIATATLLLFIWVCFAYPTGRIDHRPSLLVLQISSGVLGILLAANLLLSRVPPVAGPFVRCSGHECPPNPIAVVSLSDGAARGLSTAVGLATALTLLATAATLLARAKAATPLQRHSLIPMAAWGALASVSFGVFITVRAVDPNADALASFAVAVAAIIVLLPLAIGAGLVRGRVLAMSALEHLILDLRESSSLANLQRRMAAVFEDPKLRLLAWRESSRGYVDSTGAPSDVSSISGDRTLTEFTREGRLVGAAVHDSILADDVVRAAGSVVVLALENDRLHSDLTRSVRALESSRQRVMSAADRERRRIEQDLHDGAQQGLIALRIKLHLLRDIAESDPQSVAAGLTEAGARVDTAIDQIRNLAQGVYPSVLRDLGLSYALPAVTRELPVEVGLHIEVKRRLDPEVETAVYFCCVEALQNAVKHAGADARIDLWMRETRGQLQFAVADSGCGFDHQSATAARGLNGMSDRIEAVGGTLAIRSAPGEGTTVTGVISRPTR